MLALSSQVLGWLLITASLPRLPAALTSVLLTVQPVGSVALAALIFGESPSGLQLFGVLLVLAALMAVGRSRRPARAVRARIPPHPPLRDPRRARRDRGDGGRDHVRAPVPLRRPR